MLRTMISDNDLFGEHNGTLSNFTFEEKVPELHGTS